MSIPTILIAITFLLRQVICDLYISTLTAGMVNKGIVVWDTKFIWYQGSIVLVVTIIAIGLSLYSNPLYSIIQELIDKLNLIFKEGLSGVKVIRAFNKENHEYILFI